MGLGVVLVVYTGTSTKVVLRVGAEVFAFFLAVGPGRRQVFNEYFHFSLAVWRDNASSRWRGVRLEHRGRRVRRAPSGAQEGLQGGEE